MDKTKNEHIFNSIFDIFIEDILSFILINTKYEILTISSIFDRCFYDIDDIKSIVLFLNNNHNFNIKRSYVDNISIREMFTYIGINHNFRFKTNV